MTDGVMPSHDPMTVRTLSARHVMALLALVALLAGCGLTDERPSTSTGPGDATAAGAVDRSPSPDPSGGGTTEDSTAPRSEPPDAVAAADGDGAERAAAQPTQVPAPDRSSEDAGDGDGAPATGDRARDDTSNGQRRDPSGVGDGRDDGAATGMLARGDRGAQVRRLQRRLRTLRYWVGPIDGVYGQLTEQAVFAFQGVEGLAIDGIVGPNTRAALDDASPPTPRSSSGDLIEVDERARVVMDVRDGRARWTWHTSTGTNREYQHPAGYTALAETPDGRHTIDWQVDGWRRNELGRLWRPKYFHPDGIAIHGFSSVPAAPSSHGCVRVTIPAMNFIWNNGIAPQGSTVWVYGRPP